MKPTTKNKVASLLETEPDKWEHGRYVCGSKVYCVDNKTPLQWYEDKEHLSKLVVGEMYYVTRKTYDRLQVSPYDPASDAVSPAILGYHNRLRFAKIKKVVIPKVIVPKQDSEVRKMIKDAAKAFKLIELEEVSI